MCLCVHMCIRDATLLLAFAFFLHSIPACSAGLHSADPDVLQMWSPLYKQGGVQSSPLCQEVIRLWKWCHQYGITLLPQHFPGVSNNLADFLSRYVVQPRAITTEVYHKHHIIVYHRNHIPWLGGPEIVLFGTEDIIKCPNFCSKGGESPGLLPEAFFSSAGTGIQFFQRPHTSNICILHTTTVTLNHVTPNEGTPQELPSHLFFS